MRLGYLPFCAEEEIKCQRCGKATEKIRIGKPVIFQIQRANESKDGILSNGGEIRYKQRQTQRSTFNSYISLFDAGRQITGSPITIVDPIVFYFYKSIQYKSNIAAEGGYSPKIWWKLNVFHLWCFRFGTRLFVWITKNSDTVRNRIWLHSQLKLLTNMHYASVSQKCYCKANLYFFLHEYLKTKK